MAQRTPRPKDPTDEYAPELATLVDAPPRGDVWLHEVKLDGYRIGLAVEGKTARLLSRKGKDWTQEFPEIAKAARELGAGRAIIDGELVMLDERGVSSFQSLQNRGRSRKGLTYFAFDLLQLDDEDLRAQPIEVRKRKLKKLLGRSGGLIRYSQEFDAAGATVFRHACQLGAEGIVSKRRGSPYRSGVRSSDWQKSKCVRRQELVVGGFTDSSSSARAVGSLQVGYYEGDKLRWAGKVGAGTGWTEAFGRALRRRLEPLEQPECPFQPKPRGWLGANAHWLAPTLVVEVEFMEWTAGGHVRHPRLRGFREDKPAREVVRETSRPAPMPAPATPSTERVQPSRVASSRSSLVYPAVGISKRDLLQLFESIADTVLPHLANRPLTVVKRRGPITKPDALRSQCRFVHHTRADNAWAPASVPRLEIPEQKKLGNYLWIDGLPALLALLEGGVAELHTWNARVDDVERPDRVVFDLDPGETVEWSEVVVAARLVRAELERIDMASWVKSTGGKGLHVVVPFARGPSWSEVFSATRSFAETLVRLHPRLTTEFALASRKGRILIDYKRNYRTSIAVAAYSPRARPDATVSVPLAWSELRRDAAPAISLLDLRARIARLKADPWAGYFVTRQRFALRSAGQDAAPVSR